jgi:hypothetical protein
MIGMAATSAAVAVLAFGSIMGVFPVFPAFQFGTKNSSMNYGTNYERTN